MLSDLTPHLELNSVKLILNMTRLSSHRPRSLQRERLKCIRLADGSLLYSLLDKISFQ